MNEWEIERIFIIIADNASLNDVAIAYFKKRFKTKDEMILDGEIMCVRFYAHIVNLIVNEGLKELHLSIIAI